jgi:hypothetical protein
MDSTNSINVSAFCRKHGFPRNLLYDHLKRFIDEQREDGRSSREEFPERGFFVTFDREVGRAQYRITDKEAFKRFALRLTDYAALTNEELEALIDAAGLAKEAVLKEGKWRLVHVEKDEYFPPNFGYWTKVAQALEKVM